MNKLMAAVVVGCLAASVSWGRSFSIDLRPPAVKTGVRAAARLKAVPSAAGGSEFLRKVNLNAGSADVGRVSVGDELAFTLFDDVAITLTLKKQMPSPLGGDVFIADASGYEGVKNAVVLRTAEGLTVDIQDYRNKKVYKVISTATGVVVQEMESKGGTCGCDTLKPAKLPVGASGRPRKAQKVVAAKNEVSGEVFVDILVAYDNGAATWAIANGGGITNFAQTAVQKMNAVLANNGLDDDFRFRLVGVLSIAASTADLDYALEAATNGSGDWAPIKAKRDEVGADVVTVLVDTGTDEGTIGLGWSLDTTDFESFSENAYNCCAIRSVAQSHTMTHEVGHNMGCGHATAQYSDPGPQLYSYSAGYYFTADEENYHTIMAYGGEGPGGAEAPYFSSPNHAYLGVAVGDATHDNARTLSNTFAAVSQWRDAVGGEIGDGETSDEDMSEPLTWLTSRDEAFAKAIAEGKNIFLIYGRDTCGNTMGTRNFSCEDPSVKRYLLRDYVCWYSNCDTQSEESSKYFCGYNGSGVLPFIAVIDATNDVTLIAEGGYHYVDDLRLMLGNVVKEVTFSPEAGTTFEDALQVTLTTKNNGTIYYTLDGTMPDENSLRYDSPLTLTATATIRAAALSDGVWSLPAGASFTKSCSATIGGYEWAAHVVEGGCVLVSATPELAGVVAIPAKIGGYNVVRIDDMAFAYCAALVSVVIPECVESIGEDAFSYCGRNFKEAWIPAHLEYGEMGYDSFYNWDDEDEQEYEVELHYYSGSAPDIDLDSASTPKEVYNGIWGAVNAAAASEYNGFVWDEDGDMKGTIQVKVGKPNKKTGLATVKATVVVGTKKVTLKAKDKGKAVIEQDGPTEVVLVGGEECVNVLGADEFGGSYGAYAIDGARNFFASKDKAELAAANAALSKWLGGVSIIADAGSFTVTISAKGKAKVSGTLANGAKATGNAVFLVGEELACVPVALPKANIYFALWLPLDGGEVFVSGLGDDVIAGRAGALKAGAEFRIDADEFAAVTGIDALPYLPDGVSVEPKGAKWVVAGGAKAGKVAYRRGTQEVDESKLGENPSGLKLTYKKADGSFKGSFKAYAEVKGKLKATTVSVSGIVLNGVGYGTATVKGKSGVPVTIE